MMLWVLNGSKAYLLHFKNTCPVIWFLICKRQGERCLLILKLGLYETVSWILLLHYARSLRKYFLQIGLE